MKTCLYTTLFLDGKDDRGNSRFMRAVKWVKFYAALKDELGFDDLVLCDGGSDHQQLNHFLAICRNLKLNYTLLRGKKLAGTNKNFDYPWCWQGVWKLREVVELGYTKIICIESDFFVLSKLLADLIREDCSSWWTIQEKKYGWPESALQIINESGFSLLMNFTHDHWGKHLGKCFETTLPFTGVFTSLAYARFGEQSVDQMPFMDGYGQCPLSVKLEFIRSEKHRLALFPMLSDTAP